MFWWREKLVFKSGVKIYLLLSSESVNLKFPAVPAWNPREGHTWLAGETSSQLTVPFGSDYILVSLDSLQDMVLYNTMIHLKDWPLEDRQYK